MKKKFNWDEYIERTPYNTVLNGMESVRRIIPTMYSNDKEQIYLKTQDIEYEVNDTESLNRILPEILESLKEEAKNAKWSYERLYLLEIDYLIVSSILNDQCALPEEYKHPEHYLKLAMKEFNNKNN